MFVPSFPTKLFVVGVLAFSLQSCLTLVTPSGRGNMPSVATTAARNFPEGFDTGSKRTYESATVSLPSGLWTLDEAVIGSAENDQRNGEKSVRMRENGRLSMQFDVPTGIAQVRLKHGVYATDQPSAWQLWVSSDAGRNWEQLSNTIETTAKNLSELAFEVNIRKPCRVEIRKIMGGTNRLNIDDIVVVTFATSADNPIPDTTVPTKDDNLALGNPSNASTSDSDNYLLVKNSYALSYNRNRGIPNWVSWHLSAAWKGEAQRQNDFRPDTNLPPNWFAATPKNYSDSGFDRGHLCPSDDRDADVEMNQETFLMTNIVPQAPENNRNIWKNLEEYSRKLAAEGNELYITAGTNGQGGTGANGKENSIANGKIIVPASLWKIIVVLPVGTNDLSRISADTRIIAVNIPNTNQVGPHDWSNYRVSIRAIEDLTGHRFLSNLPSEIRQILVSKVGATREGR